MGKSFKYLSLEVIYLAIIVLFLARPTVLFNSIDPRMNPLGFLLYLAPCAYLAHKHEIEFGRKFYVIVGTYSIWVVCHCFTDSELKILSYIFLYAHIFVAYTLVRVFHTELFGYFWRIVTALAFVDFILWIGIHFVDLTLLEQISPFTPTSSTSGASFIIFNSPGARYDELGILGLLRNCGFAWEPGLYGSILLLAAYFNLAETGYQIKGNFPLYILGASIFSTFSTTAYSAFLILLAVHMFFMVKSRITFTHIIGVCCLIGIIMAASRLPFMREKIEEDLNMENTLSGSNENLSWVEEDAELRTVKRTEGIYLDVLNFIDSPILGYGIDPVNSYVTKEISPYLVTSNDITSFFAKWGLVYTVFLWILIARNSHFLRKYVLWDDNSLACVYICIAVSYSLSLCAIIMCFMLYKFLEDENIIEDLIYEYEEIEHEYDEYEDNDIDNYIDYNGHDLGTKATLPIRNSNFTELK